jgi:hypothetical protein
MKIFCVIISALLFSAAFSGCESALDWATGIVQTQPKPTAKTTITSEIQVNKAVQDALKSGKTELQFDIKGGKSEIDSIMDDMPENLSPFWGSPTQYKVTEEFTGIDLGEREGRNANVARVELTLEPSDNYYVYRAYTDASFTIPDDRTRAAEIFAALPGIIAEIDALTANNAGSPSYALTLAAHDWLVSNLDYNDNIEQSGYHNGIYGALVERSTMCLGYAEAMQLILMCKGEKNVEMVLGKSRNEGSKWIGHAWNLVKIDEEIMHVDATFDDPGGDKKNTLNHVYFGQNDAFMKANHVWSEKYYPPAVSENYYYFRENGLFVTDSDAFRETVQNVISKNRPAELEIAAEGFEIKDDNLQFIYGIKGVEKIYRSITNKGEITVVRLSLTYGE